jgi:hypothetical protein
MTFAQQANNLQDKIERLTWLLNLFLLDGFDRAELEQLMRDVGQFSEACRLSNRRAAA